MRVKVKQAGKITIWIPIPLVCASLAIRFIPEAQLGKEQKEIILQIIKVCRKHFKTYRGLTIVDVEASDGTKVKVTL